MMRKIILLGILACLMFYFLLSLVTVQQKTLHENQAVVGKKYSSPISDEEYQVYSAIFQHMASNLPKMTTPLFIVVDRTHVHDGTYDYFNNRFLPQGKFQVKLASEMVKELGENWYKFPAAVKQKYPNVVTIVRFSRIGFSGNKDFARVYLTFQEINLCDCKKPDIYDCSLDSDVSLTKLKDDWTVKNMYLHTLCFCDFSDRPKNF